MKEKVLRLHGKVQNYAWGGFDFIPALLGLQKEPGCTYAEYWMGAHPSASSTVDIEECSENLFQLIKKDPSRYIGDAVQDKFGELPYLFKILDVNDMLSIQVHPSRAEAIKGFEAEEKAGIPIHAANRNYKDRNHKPEIMVALSEFWLLHGFKETGLLKQTLRDVPELNYLLPVFENSGYYELYRQVMELPQAEVDRILLPLVYRELAANPSKEQPGYWVKKLFAGMPEMKNIDRGVFSIYFFNIVGVQPGEAVFQSAGVPHAYLEGQNVELMANSDNVLRGGLTPKHVDVPELLKHTLFEGIIPDVLAGNPADENERTYPCPVEDFDISAIRLEAGKVYRHESISPEIYILTGGSVVTDIHTHYKRGESFFAMPGTVVELTAQSETLIYKAFVGM